MNTEHCNRPCYQNNRTPLLVKKPRLEKLQLVLFDMDGVLTDIHSSWQYVHDNFNSSNEQSVQAYMKGDITDEEFIKRDVSLWKKNNEFITQQQLTNILSPIPLMNGAVQLFSFLHDHDIKTVIVSAGLDLLAKKVASTLSIPHVYANGLTVDAQQRLTGEGLLRVKLMYKEKTVKHIAAQLNIPFKHMASVGNSCFDIPMLKSTGLGIAFNPSDECIKQQADIIVKQKNLKKLIPIFESYLPE